ncbi:MAG: hypothetical protein ACRDBP_09285, partial [Luteolibacter sp.]
MKNLHFSKITTCLLASLLIPLSSATAIESLTVGANPESLTRGFDGKYFVTLMGETRTEGDGNGSIIMLDGREVSTFCTGMDDPKGIVLMGDFLITADFKKVWKINSKGEKEVLAGPEAF